MGVWSYFSLEFGVWSLEFGVWSYFSVEFGALLSVEFGVWSLELFHCQNFPCEIKITSSLSSTNGIVKSLMNASRENEGKPPKKTHSTRFKIKKAGQRWSVPLLSFCFVCLVVRIRS